MVGKNDVNDISSYSRPCCCLQDFRAVAVAVASTVATTVATTIAILVIVVVTAVVIQVVTYVTALAKIHLPCISFSEC